MSNGTKLPLLTTVGALRGAAYMMCEHLRGTEFEAEAVQLHDSLVRALPGLGSITIKEVGFLTGG